MLLIIIIVALLFPSQALAEPIVKITNFSSNSSPEWVEIYNQSPDTLDLSNWSLGDANTQVLYDLPLTGCLSPNTYQTFFHDSGWLNDSGDTINLYQQDVLIDSLVYASGKLDLTYKTTNTCVPTVAPTIPPTSPPTNTPTSAPLPTITPTATPNPTNTPVPTNTPQPTSTHTPTPTNTPKPSPTQTPTIIDTPTPSSGPSIEPTPFYTPFPTEPVTSEILGESTTVASSSNAKSSFTDVIPILFIVGGGLLLVTPLIISKLPNVKK